MATTAAECGLVITGLAHHFGHEFATSDVLGDQLENYIVALADIPVEHLKAGCRLAIQSRAFFPRVAELRRDVDAALEREDVQRAADRLLNPPPKPVEDANASPYVCKQCADTAWVIVASGDQGIPGVRRCMCAATNPSLPANRRRRYAKDAA